MILNVIPGNSLNGQVALPGDKSLSHRAALFAALAEGESRIENFLVSGVTQAMLEALTALEVPWEINGAELRVVGKGLAGLGRRTAEKAPLHIQCGNSATTLRLLAGALAAVGVPAVLDGSPGLRRRPMARIVEPLQRMGVPVEATLGCAPLILHSGVFPLQPLTYALPVASAQVKSCLLLAALAADGPTVLYEPGPSRDHTERMLRSMGVDIHSRLLSAVELPGKDTRPVKPGLSRTVYETRLVPPKPLSLAPLSLKIPGDFSSAAFLIVAALVTPGSDIQIQGVGLNPTRTGLLDALEAMGADIRISAKHNQHGEPAGDLQVRHSHLRGTQISGSLVVRMIDEFPAFAIAAAFAQGPTIVGDASELRLKESDRIAALCQGLRALGVDAQETADGFVISGRGSVPGGRADACGDHRLAMSLATAGLAAQAPVTIRGAEITAESFPDFEITLQALGAEVERELTEEASR